jgi:hypothetical protein
LEKECKKPDFFEAVRGYQLIQITPVRWKDHRSVDTVVILKGYCVCIICHVP